MYTNHANGVLGISAFKVAGNDLPATAADYDKMGFNATERNEGLVKYSVYRHQEVHLVSASGDSSLSEFASVGADGVFAIQFDVLNLDSTYQYLKDELPPSAMTKTENRLTIGAKHAFGVQLEFVQEPEEQSTLARKLTPSQELDTLAIQYSGELYTKYCALCHGENREGYAADHAPSLRSKSLLATSMNNNFMRYTMQFGRANTAMAGYLETQGGPLEHIEIELLLAYLQQMAEVDEPVELSREPSRVENYTMKTAQCVMVKKAKV